MVVSRRRAPLLTLAPAPAMQRQKSSWDSLVASGILLQASTHLKRCLEMVAVCWRATVITSKRGKSRGFSRYFSLPTSAGQERASFHLRPKDFCSQMDLGFSRSAIPLREGEPKPKQPSWRYAISTEITQDFSPHQPQRKDFIQRQWAPSRLPCGEKHVENLTAVSLLLFH